MVVFRFFKQQSDHLYRIGFFYLNQLLMQSDIVMYKRTFTSKVLGHARVSYLAPRLMTRLK